MQEHGGKSGLPGSSRCLFLVAKDLSFLIEDGMDVLGFPRNGKLFLIQQ